MLMPDKILLENVARIFNAALAGGIIKTTTDAQTMVAVLEGLKKRLNQAAVPPQETEVPTLPTSKS